MEHDSGESGSEQGGKTPKPSFSRQRIEAEMEVYESHRKRILLAQRLDYAKNGIIACSKNKHADGLRYFHKYFENLEEAKDISEANLGPSHFDVKTDMAELVLISGIYWEMVKLYDRTQSTDKYQEFLRVLAKYVEFSKGMPFERVAREVMRKYLTHGKPNHTQELKDAYRMMGGSRCFVATALSDLTTAETQDLLRDYRDVVLMNSIPGRIFVRSYYCIGPGLASVIRHLPVKVRRPLAQSLDRFADAIRPSLERKRLSQQGSGPARPEEELSFLKIDPEG